MLETQDVFATKTNKCIRYKDKIICHKENICYKDEIDM